MGGHEEVVDKLHKDAQSRDQQLDRLQREHTKTIVLLKQVEKSAAHTKESHQMALKHLIDEHELVNITVHSRL